VKICIYCGEPIMPGEEAYTGFPAHDACMNDWYEQADVTGNNTAVVSVEKDSKQVKKEEKFTRDLLVGNFFKNLVITILYNAGYEVYPFGYESFLANIKRPLYNTETLGSETAERIRSAPDLIVLDRKTGDLNLVEVKFRGHLWDNKKADVNVKLYRKYWSESVLVLICPRDEIFYAQFVRNLTREDNKFPVAQDFLPLEEVFKLVSWEHPVRKGFYTNLVRIVSRSL
jgi:hypothetical protein